MNRETLQLVLETEDFYHMVQPIVNVGENRVHGYEFLFRSNHVQNIESFFKYAKSNKQIIDLDLNSVKKIIRMIEIEYSKNANLLWFINIQPETLIHPDFSKQLFEWIERKNINSRSIVFELNEDVKDVEITSLKAAVREFKNRGFLIAMDDVGKAESSIRMILELEPNIMKIDRFFANDLSNSPKKQKILLKLLEMFGDEIDVIVEGIENQPDLWMTKNLGVTFVQGYYLGKPQKQEFYFETMEQINR